MSASVAAVLDTGLRTAPMQEAVVVAGAEEEAKVWLHLF